MSDISGGTIHYRCAFDATCVNSNWTDSYPDLSKRVRTWVEDTLAVPRDTFKNRNFLNGGSFKEECPPRTSFETLARNYNTEGVAPTYWGCRLTHPCTEFAHRKWTHDFTITCHTPNEFRLVLVTRHSITGYLGQEPAPPEPFVPGIIQSLATSRHWRCTSGSELLNGKPVQLYPGHINLMKNALLNKSRGCPIVYVSCSQESDQPLVDVGNLAELLCGAAVVYVTSSSSLDSEVETLLENFGTWNGGIRVYQSVINPENPFDYHRHRFFSPSDIRNFGTEEVFLQIIRACCRRAPVLKSNDVVSIEDIVNVARRRKLRELTQSSTSAIDPEFLELAQEMERENSHLIQDIAQLRDELETLQLSWDIKVGGAESEMARLEFELGSYKQSTQTVYQRNRELEAAAESVQALRKLPSSLPEMLELICRIHGDKLEFVPEALASAQAAKYSDLAKAWDLLWSLADPLYLMLFDSNTPFSDAEYKSKTGFNIAMSEGRQTQRDTKLMRLRKREYQGRTIDITPHVGSGTGSDCIRIHFAVDQEARKLIIGHCGDHLDNALSKKRT